jgi:hypothetical protein
VQDEWTKGSRAGECLWKQSNINERLGEQCIKGEHLICTLRFDFLNANLVPKTPLDIVPDFSNENLVSKNGILGLPKNGDIKMDAAIGSRACPGVQTFSAILFHP